MGAIDKNYEAVIDALLDGGADVNYPHKVTNNSCWPKDKKIILYI